jgi:hypothetical protein
VEIALFNVKVVMKKILSLLLILFMVMLFSSCSTMEVPLPGISKAVFHDEFVQGHTGNWILESDELGSTVIVPEQLLIDLNSPNLIQYAMLTEPTFSNFVLEVEARLVNGSLNSTYGVMFRMHGPEEFYRFEITGDGMYLIERHDLHGGWYRFTDDWRDTVAINQGPGATNILKVVANGPKIAVYVNDTLLEEVIDDSYSAGNIALDAGTFDGGGIQVSFDNLAVYPPDDQ